MKTRLMLVGGFLGAGKTTLLWEAAQRLAGRGRRVGLVTNDQAPELVDTAWLSRSGVRVAEVSGSCFCCNFNGLLHALTDLKAGAEADVIIAEPVGSCTDLSATIVQPLKERSRREVAVAPLTVLADPARLGDILDGGTAGLHPSAAYIFRKQLEEADIVAISKADLLTVGELAELKARLARACPAAAVCALSAKTGQGLDEWLEEMLAGSNAGRRLAEVDYDIYAEGEAVLGWLNATVRLSGREGADWAAVCRSVLAGLQTDLQEQGAAVAHLKVFLSADGEYVLANLTRTDGEISLRGEMRNAPAAVEMVVNARAELPPDRLEALVRRRIADLTGESVHATVADLRSLRPGRPNPTHRYGAIVTASDD